jgi:hypothetical protein
VLLRQLESRDHSASGVTPASEEATRGRVVDHQQVERSSSRELAHLVATIMTTTLAIERRHCVRTRGVAPAETPNAQTFELRDGGPGEKAQARQQLARTQSP